MVAFAQSSDLETRLGVTFTSGQVAQADQLLEDASEHLRSIIGQSVYPAVTVSFDVWVTPGERDVPVPFVPVASITSVTINSVVVQASLVDGRILLALPAVPPSAGLYCDPVAVTVVAVVGVPTVPVELVSWTCVLASQVLSTIEELGGLGSGEVTSLKIDDYGKGFTSNAGVFAVPDRVADRLRAKFGGGSYVIGSWLSR